MDGWMVQAYHGKEMYHILRQSLAYLTTMSARVNANHVYKYSFALTSDDTDDSLFGGSLSTSGLEDVTLHIVPPREITLSRYECQCTNCKRERTNSRTLPVPWLHQQCNYCLDAIELNDVTAAQSVDDESIIKGHAHRGGDMNRIYHFCPRCMKMVLNIPTLLLGSKLYHLESQTFKTGNENILTILAKEVNARTSTSTSTSAGTSQSYQFLNFVTMLESSRAEDDYVQQFKSDVECRPGQWITYHGDESYVNESSGSKRLDMIADAIIWHKVPEVRDLYLDLIRGRHQQYVEILNVIRFPKELVVIILEYYGLLQLIINRLPIICPPITSLPQ
jgi:hypothetical protein